MAKNQKAEGINKAQWEQIRKHLRNLADNEYGSIAALAKEIGAKANTLVSFILGRSKGLSQETVDALTEKGLMPALVKENAPMQEWDGERKTTGQAAEEKGVTPATIRRWCRAGKLNYLRVGRRYVVAIDAKYAAIAPTEKAVLRTKVAELTAENAALREQVKSFDFDSAADHVPTAADQVPHSAADQVPHIAAAANAAPQSAADIHKTHEETAQRLGFFPVYCGERRIGDWRMQCDGATGSGVWPAARVNGLISPAKFRLPLDISREIIVDDRRKRVVVPEKMAKKLEASR